MKVPKGWMMASMVVGLGASDDRVTVELILRAVVSSGRRGTDLRDIDTVVLLGAE
jgi:hypothetical protein